MSARPISVLFVCTGNSARSILAEALLRQAGGPGFLARSAGTDPTAVHPLALRVLTDAGIDVSGLRSKPLDEVRAETFDYVITLCDDARVACPVFPGADQSLHWGYADPTAVTGTDAERLAAFEQLTAQLGRRVRQFVLLAGRNQPDAAESIR